MDLNPLYKMYYLANIKQAESILSITMQVTCFVFRISYFVSRKTQTNYGVHDVYKKC